MTQKSKYKNKQTRKERNNDKKKRLLAWKRNANTPITEKNITKQNKTKQNKEKNKPARRGRQDKLKRQEDHEQSVKTLPPRLKYPRESLAIASRRSSPRGLPGVLAPPRGSVRRVFF